MKINLLRLLTIQFAALFIAGLTVGCHHDHDDSRNVRVVDEMHHEHNGYYDDDRHWHGGYDDENHIHHDDPADWHQDNGHNR